MSYFEHNGIRLYYEIAGGGPPLILINGLASDTRQWQPLINILKSSFKIISYDMRCAGRSDKPDLPFTIGDIAEEAYALVRHLRHDRIDLLGFSMGGMAAMKLALEHPDLVRKLFLVSTAPSLKRPHPPSDDTLKMFQRTDVSPELLTQVYETVFGGKYRQSVSAEEFVRFRMGDKEPQPALAYLRQMEALLSCDLFEDVGKISAPTVVIAGSEDQLIPPENSIWLSEHLADSKLCLIDGAGHMVPVEASEEVAVLIGAHL